MNPPNRPPGGSALGKRLGFALVTIGDWTREITSSNRWWWEWRPQGRAVRPGVAVGAARPSRLELEGDPVIAFTALRQVREAGDAARIHLDDIVEMAVGQRLYPVGPV